MPWVHYKAPFELFDVDQTGNAVGHIVESFVVEEYLKHVGRQYVFPANQKDFSDFTAGFANVTLYTTFLQQNNPNLSLSQLLWMRGRGLRRIPDICTHDDPRRFEYYEIKPNSTSGRFDGIQKLSQIDAFNDNFNLPYKPGKIWNPEFYIIWYDDTLQGIPTQLAFHITRIRPGLIAYDIAFSRYPLVFTENDILELSTKFSAWYAKQIAGSFRRRITTIGLGSGKLFKPK